MSEKNHFRDLEEMHQNTIQEIQNLQEMEKYMFQNLQKLAPGGENALEQEAVIGKINDLKNIRTNLLKQLSNDYSTTQDDLNNERNALADKLTQVKIVENELDRARSNVSMLENDANSKKRMVQLYEYQRKRYSAYTDVMKIVVYCTIAILAFALLMKYNPIPGIPSEIYTMLITITVFVTIILLSYKFIDINSRNNLNFDQYDFAFDPSQHATGYETVYQHDMKALGKIEGEIGINSATNICQMASQAEKNVESAADTIMKMGTGVAAGAGQSSGIANDPTFNVKAPNSTSVVMPSQSSKETFASI